MNLAEWLARAAMRAPTAPALLTGTTIDADYAAFARRAGQIAAGLNESFAIMPGDRVALYLSNCTDYLELLYGILWAGAVAVPINYKLHPREAAWIVGNAEAKLVVTSADLREDLAGLLPDVAVLAVDGPAIADLKSGTTYGQPVSRGRDDLAWLFYTSGTTGRPKGVMLTHGNLQAMTYTYFADVDDVAATDAALYAAPLSHGAGMYNFVHVLRGARHVVPVSGSFDEDEILALAPTLGQVSMFAAPTMVRRLIDRAKALGGRGEGIKTIVYGGGPMYLADIEDAVATLGPRFVQIYGQGESPMTITALSRTDVADRRHPRWRERLASVGVAQSCVHVRVTDADGMTLPIGDIGEIQVKGPTVMAGYWRNPEATAQAIRDGWLFTGDMGVLDADGYLTLRDRSKDVIISGGTNIYPREVEEALLIHPGVHEVSVLGQSSAEWGEEVVAFVVAAAGVTPDAATLDAHCLDQIARFKRPKRYFFVDELPKNNYGKVLKTELRARLAKMEKTA